MNVPDTATFLAGALTQGAIPLPGHTIGQPVEVTLLGRGQTNHAWRVSTSTGTFLLRIPHRPTDQAPRSMFEEFAALARVPAQVGTRGIAYAHTEQNPLGCRWILATFVEGAEKPAAQWSRDDLRALASTLARLHDRVEPLAGPVTSPTSREASVLGLFESSLAWWQQHRPDLVVRHAELVEQVRDYVTHRQQAGGVLRGGFSFVHGDVIVGNVILGPGGSVGLVDWEWAEIGDPARDLALIGGPVHGAPDYVPMTDDQTADFVSAYLDQTSALGRLGERAEVLLLRRDAHEACERLFTCLHQLSLAPGNPGAWGPTMVNDVLGLLDARTRGDTCARRSR